MPLLSKEGTPTSHHTEPMQQQLRHSSSDCSTLSHSSLSDTWMPISNSTSTCPPSLTAASSYASSTASATLQEQQQQQPAGVATVQACVPPGQLQMLQDQQLQPASQPPSSGFPAPTFEVQSEPMALPWPQHTVGGSGHNIWAPISTQPGQVVVSGGMPVVSGDMPAQQGTATDGSSSAPVQHSSLAMATCAPQTGPVLVQSQPMLVQDNTLGNGQQQVLLLQPHINNNTQQLQLSCHAPSADATLFNTHGQAVKLYPVQEQHSNTAVMMTMVPQEAMGMQLCVVQPEQYQQQQPRPLQLVPSQAAPQGNFMISSTTQAMPTYIVLQG